MKKGFLVTDGFFHPPFFGRMILHQMLRNGDGYRFEHTRSLEKLPAALGDFSALVVYIHHETIADKAVRTFDEYVSSGGGVLAIHSATASSKGNDAFTDILGGKFIGHGPGRVCYTCPGHLVAAFRVPEYREILVRGLTWVAEREK